LKLSSQSGASLIETLIAIAILFASVTYATISIVQMMKFSSSRSAVQMIFESDQVLRYEIRLLLSRFQKRILEYPPASQCGGTDLKNTMDHLAQHQDSFLDGLTAFGSYSRILGSKYSLHKKIVQSHAELQNSLGKAGVQDRNPMAKSLAQAINRCQSQQTFSSVTPMGGRRSFYLCGYGENFVLETKAIFFDFNTSEALRCNQMNERPGRGFKVYYQIHNFTKAATEDLEFSYSIRRTDGLLDVTKNVNAI